MSGREREEPLVSRNSVIDGELPRWGNRRVEGRGGDMHGLADMPGGDRGIVIGQGVQDVMLRKVQG